MIDPTKLPALVRPSGTYLVDNMDVLPQPVPVTITFPPQFEVEDLRETSVEAAHFATQHATGAAWCDFVHPGNRRWCAVLASSDMMGAAAPKRPMPAKRPTR